MGGTDKCSGKITRVLFNFHTAHITSCCPNANKILPKLPVTHQRSSGSELSDSSVSSNTTCEIQLCIATKKSGWIALPSFEQTRAMTPATRNDLWCEDRKVYGELCKRRNKIIHGKHGEHQKRKSIGMFLKPELRKSIRNYLNPEIRKSVGDFLDPEIRKYIRNFLNPEIRNSIGNFLKLELRKSMQTF